jgi:hypothetical protein
MIDPVSGVGSYRTIVSVRDAAHKGRWGFEIAFLFHKS